MADVVAPMTGKVLKVHVKPGDAVNENDVVVTLEAMKMEIPVVAPASGTVKEVNVSPGQAVSSDTVLLVIE